MRYEQDLLLGAGGRAPRNAPLVLLASALAVLGGCSGGDDITAFPPDLAPYFPTDGARRAEYVSADQTLAWHLVVEKTTTDQVDGLEHVTFEWTNEDSGEWLGAVTWSSDDDILVHAWTDAAGVVTTYDPPVALTGSRMDIGDTVTTDTGGRTFTSTFVGYEDCSVAWGHVWEDCLHIVLDDGDGDRMAGPPFAGEYWLVTTYGPAWMLLDGFEAKWDLFHYEWDAE